MKGISWASHLHEYGVKAFLMMTPFNYLEWIVLLLFIHLYIHKKFYAWHVALIMISTVIVAFLPVVLFSETPSDSYLSEWHFRAMGLAVFLLLIFYMYTNYKPYKTFVNTDNLLAKNNLDHNLENSVPQLENPLANFYIPAIWLFLLNSFSLIGRILDSDAAVSPFAIWFWFANMIFICLYKSKNRFTCDVAIFVLLSILVYSVIMIGNGNDILIQLSIKIIITISDVILIGYILAKRKPYKNYIEKYSNQTL
jgi:hypothetical protein